MSSAVRTLKGTPKAQEAKPEILSREHGRGFLEEFNNLVARRAYDLFEQDGRVDGNHLAHWLDAERQLAAPLPDVRESADSFTAAISLSDVPVGNAKVYATEDRAIIYAEKDLPGNADGPYQIRESTYYMIRWPEIVDPATCSAEIDDQNLTIRVRKAESPSNTGTGSSEGL
jgi:HSP20 family molecular chaperone IbpA